LAAAERVFRALTDSDQLTRWFTDASCPVKFWQMDARLGGSYSYATEKSNIVVKGVSEFKCRGEIVEFDPPRLLVYTGDRQLASRSGEENDRALGTHAHRFWHTRESDAQRTRTGPGVARRLQRRLAWCGRKAQTIRGNGKGVGVERRAFRPSLHRIIFYGNGHNLSRSGRNSS
jgi:uncharacterized protein YndB with AHSA1/START domain